VSWFYDILLDIFNGLIKDELQNALQKAMCQSIDTNANKAISTLPISQVIGPFALTYGLTNNPRFAYSYFTTDETGEFFDRFHETPTPYPVPTMPDVLNGDMVQIVLSDYTFNSASYSAFEAGLLKVSISADIIPPNYRNQLNTNYYAKSIPALYTKYPNLGIEATGCVTQMPIFTVNTTGSFSTVATRLDVCVLVNEVKIPAFSLNINVKLGGKAIVSGIKLIPYIYFIDFQASLYSSNIGNFSVVVEGVSDVIQEIIDLLIPIINAKLAPGFLLPVVDKVSLVDTDLIYGTNYFAVTTNAQYAGLEKITHPLPLPKSDNTKSNSKA